MPEFEAIMSNNGFGDHTPVSRLISRPCSDLSPVEMMIQEIGYFTEMHEEDPDKAEDYRRFLTRSWQESGYTNTEIQSITADAFRIIAKSRR